MLACLALLALACNLGGGQEATPAATATPLPAPTETPVPPAATPAQPAASATSTAIPPPPPPSPTPSSTPAEQAPAPPSEAPWANLGRIVFISDRDGRAAFFQMAPEGGEAEPMHLLYDGSSFDWSPDGSQLAYVAQPDGNDDILRINDRATDWVRLTTDTAGDTDPAWSADGLAIAFATNRDPVPDHEGPPLEIYAMVAADGSDQRRLTQNTTSDYCPAWSPDGEWLAFSSFYYSYPTVRIDLIPAAGGEATLLVDTEGDDLCPRWSPDGEWIAFTVRLGFTTQDDHEIYLVRPDGSDLRPLIQDPAVDRDPSWSPDGRWLVFSSDRTGDREIYLTNVEGTTLINLTQSSGTEDWAPTWLP